MPAIHKLLLTILLLGAGVSPATGQEIQRKSFDPKGTVKARPTAGDLVARRSKNRIDPKIELAKEPIKLKQIRSGKTESLVNRSSTLSHGKHWTFVPKGSLLHVPLNYKDRVDGERNGTLLPWAQFLAKNRTWVHAQDVTLAQARGDVPFTEDEVKVYKNNGRVVVAVCHGGPISVKPPAEGKAAGTPGRGSDPVKPRPVIK